MRCLQKCKTIHVMSFALVFMVSLLIVGCGQQSQTEQVTAPQAENEKETKVAVVKPAVAVEIPRFAINSPFAKAYQSIIPKEEKKLYAKSFLWEKAPELVVEKWLTEKPETEGKYVLVEFWATWCSPCLKTIPKLNAFQQKFGDKLAIIAISDETEEDVRALKEPEIEYPIAIDTQKRLKETYAVTGIPHAVIIEPGGYVVWQGYPLQEGFELTEEIVEKILAVDQEIKTQS